MKNTRSKIIAALVMGALAASFTACDSANPSDTSTVVVTQEAGDTNIDSNNNGNSGNNNSADNNADSNGNAAQETQAALPEFDDDGSKISIVEITDAENKTVTEAGGAAVTAVAIVDNSGKVITEANGSPVPPNTVATTKEERIVTVPETTKNTNSGNTAETEKSSGAKVLAEGPTLSIPEGIEAAAGEEFTFKMSVTGNSGYTALISWLDINQEYFEFVSFSGGDPDSKDYKKSPEKQYTSYSEYTKPGTSNVLTLITLFFNMKNEPIVGESTYATVTLKVKDGTPAGTYPLEFDIDGDGTAMCNNIIYEDGKEPEIVNPTPKYKNGSVIVK